MVKVFRASLTKTNTVFNQLSVSWHKALKWFGRENINTAHLLPLSAQDTLNHTRATTGFVSGLQPSVETGLQVTRTCSIFAPAQAQQCTLQLLSLWGTSEAWSHATKYSQWIRGRKDREGRAKAKA